jgi:sRNA-binding regulator protein Hfq
MPAKSTQTPQRPRRYSQAFREPALTVSPARSAASPPTPESFFFEKQMQLQTPLVVMLDDGEEIAGILEWYDAASLRLRRLQGGRVMVYKHAIKYLHKQEGQAPGG